MTAQDKFQISHDLVFFGKVNASISHELKNILAIISETTGFLKDLAEMPLGTKSVTPETILTCCQDIIDGMGDRHGIDLIGDHKPIIL